MTVYVDSAENAYGGMKMCHMTAETLEELLVMADRIQVQRKWLQAPPKVHFAHFDIAKSKRALAVVAGAVVVPSRVLVKIAAKMTIAEYPAYATPFMIKVAQELL